MIELEIPKFEVCLRYQSISDIGKPDIPGIRPIVISGPSQGKYCPIPKLLCDIDTRNNSIGCFAASDLELDQWIFKRFQEYKESNFKFGNDMYDPTEQITVEGFFGYLHSYMRDKVITEIIQ